MWQIKLVLNLAIIAKQFGVKFMVVAPSTTVDMSLASGDLIDIEERDSKEVMRWVPSVLPMNQQKFTTPCLMTPASLIDAIVTEHGVITQPNSHKMRTVFARVNTNQTEL